MRKRARGAVLTFMAGLLLGAPSAQALSPQELCFREVINVPGSSFQQPPNVDGVIDQDLGWTGAFRYEFGNGSLRSSVVTQGIRSNSRVYLSFEVHKDTDFNNQDVILLGFDLAATSSERFHLFAIYPVHTGTGAQLDRAPRQVHYWRSSTTNTVGKITWGPRLSQPPWMNIKVTSVASSGGPTSKPSSFFVELEFVLNSEEEPRVISFPQTSNFGMYFEVIPIIPTPVPGAVTYQWPESAAPLTPGTVSLETKVPLPTQWGTSNFGSTGCGGVSFGPSDITTNNIPINKISLDNPNIFSVRLHNDSIDGSGNPVPAENVRARFRIANFGLPATESWKDVPAAGNPTQPQTIPTNDAGTLSTGPWQLDAGEREEYRINYHQCILVELDSVSLDGGTRTTFTNRSAWTNMEFGPGSTYESSAEIATRGYQLPEGMSRHRIDLLEARHFELRPHLEKTKGLDSSQPDAGGEIDQALKPREAPSYLSEMTWLFHGYRATNSHVIIDGIKHEILLPVGSFGYVIQHQLTQEELDQQREPSQHWNLKVNGLKEIQLSGQSSPNVRAYRAEIPDGQVARIDVQAQYSDKPFPPPMDGCGCRRLRSSGTIGMLGLFLLALFTRARRRRGND
ncbi:hypothetical protein [Corallococcus coralloides]|nr:hypothetical protein [Corallococcus coralloides]